MEVVTLKSKLIKKIESIDDETLLREALELLDSQTDSTDLNLPGELHAKVASARDEKKAGSYLKHEEANVLVNQWLSEQ